MTNEVTAYGQYTKEQLLAMSGQMLSGNKDFLANVFINKDPEDKFGNRTDVGVFTFNHKELGQVYSKRKESIKFSPYNVSYRYSRYDQSADNGKGATVARTVLLPDFNQEFISDDGTLKAGKGLDKFNGEGIKIGCKIWVFGTVSFEGVNAKGEAVSIKNYPAYIKLGGKKFLDFTKLFKELSGKFIFQYELDLSVVSLGGGKYATDVKWADLTKEIPFNDEMIKTLENFSNYIQLENKRIESKFKKITEKLPTAEDANDVIVGTGTLASDFVEDDDEPSED